MTKTILITGATDGIGLETAKLLRSEGHNLLLHGRSESKLAKVSAEIEAMAGDGRVATYLADLSSIPATRELAGEVLENEAELDVLINNAGVFGAPVERTGDGLDLRFAVNTIAPYILAKSLGPLLGSGGRVVNLSSAAQAPVDLAALRGERRMSDNEAYAQSKLALTMWNAALAEEQGSEAPIFIAVNPASLLGSKMVKEAYGMAGKDLSIGAEILVRAATDPAFAGANGRYFDNDAGRFANPHPDAMNPQKNAALVAAIEGILSASVE